MIKIGIDPGAKTGLAVVDNGEIIHLVTTDFWGAYDHIVHWSTSEVEIHIEDTSDLPVFHKAANKRQMSRIGLNVGKVIREAELLILGLYRIGYRVIPHRNKKSRKMDSETFRRITGWKGRTNQHERDACMLCL